MQRLEDLPCLEWKDDAGQAHRLYPNVMTSETISLESDVTEHPVEVGADITDNISPKPASLTLELFFTDTVTRPDIYEERPDVLEQTLDVPEVPPLGLLTTVTSTTNLINALGSAIGDLLGNTKKTYVATYYSEPAKRRILEAKDIIEDLRTKGTLITAFTSVGVYEEMIVQVATVVVDSTTGNGGRISLNLKRIRFAQSDVTIALPIAAVPRAQPKKEAGKGITTVPEVKSSELKKISNATGLTKPGDGL